MNKILILLFISLPGHLMAIEFDNDKLEQTLSQERKFISRLKVSTLEILIPVRLKGTRHHTLSTKLTQKLAKKQIAAISRNMWNPLLRSKLLWSQFENCKALSIKECKLYDRLFPNAAIFYKTVNKTYLLIRKDIAENKMLTENISPINNLSNLTSKRSTLFGLYSIPEDKLLIENLVYEGVCSTKYKKLNGFVTLAEYSVFSSSKLDDDEVKLKNATNDCESYVLNPAPSPRVLGRLCLQGSTLYLDGLLTPDVTYKLLNTLKNNKISRLELNSSGGNFYSSGKQTVYKIAEWIRSNKVTTNLRRKAHCGSLCTLIFQSGFKRTAHLQSKFLYHGLQWIKKAKEYSNNCMNKISDQNTPSDFCYKWKREVEKITNEAFNILDSYDLNSKLLIDKYMQQPEDENWLNTGNLSRKKDLILTPEEAMHFGILTDKPHRDAEDK